MSGSKCDFTCFVSNTLVFAILMAGLFKVFPLEACHSGSFALKNESKNMFNIFLSGKYYNVIVAVTVFPLFPWQNSSDCRCLSEVEASLTLEPLVLNSVFCPSQDNDFYR